MKIVEVINELCSRGGAEVFLVDLCVQLKKSNNVELLLIVLNDSICPSLKAKLDSENINYRCLHKKKGIDFAAAKRFKKIITEFNPNIIHTHLNCFLTYFLAFGFSKNKFKLFHTVHNVPNEDDIVWKKIIVKRLIKKDILSIVGISDSISNQTKDIYKNSDVYTVYNGICFHKQNNLISEKTYDFICVARFCYQKNHLLLLNVFKKYLMLFPQAKLALVGDGDLKKQIIEKIAELNIKDSVEIIGHVPDVYPYLWRSKCFVLSSRFEGNPISILEAMSCGLPIIAPSIGGIPDVVKDDINGLLYSEGSEEELLNAMINIGKGNKIESLSKQNFLDSKKYSIEKTAEDYLNIFTDSKNKI